MSHRKYEAGDIFLHSVPSIPDKLFKLINYWNLKWIERPIVIQWEDGVREVIYKRSLEQSIEFGIYENLGQSEEVQAFFLLRSELYE